MAEFGFSKAGNLAEVKGGQRVLEKLTSGSAVPFGFPDFGVFETNQRYTTGQRLDWIPNNYKFSVRIDSPNIGPNSAIIVLQNISNSSPDPVIGTRNLSIRNGDAILSSPASTKSDNLILNVNRSDLTSDTGTVSLTRGMQNLEGSGAGFYTGADNPAGYVGNGLINSFLNNTPNEIVVVQKKNNANYSPATGEWTFGRDLQFCFTKGDIVTGINQKGNSTPCDVISEMPNGDESMYPLIVGDYTIDDLGRTKFKLLRSQNSPLKINSVRVRSYSFTMGDTGVSTSGSGIEYSFTIKRDGTSYSISATANAGDNFTATDTITILGTQLGGTTPANDCTITVDSTFTHSGSKIGVNLTSVSGTPITTNHYSPSANTPNEIGLDITKVVSFTRKLPVHVKDLHGLVPPLFESQSGPQSLIDIQDASTNLQGSYTSLYPYFEDLTKMYNYGAGGLTITSNETEAFSVYDEESGSGVVRTLSQAIDAVRSKMEFIRDLSKTRFTTDSPFHNRTSNEVIIDGSLIIQDPSLVNSPGSSTKPGYSGHADCPGGSAVYIQETSSTGVGKVYNRAFSTFDGPWEADASVGNKKIFTHNTLAADRVRHLNVEALAFEDRVVLRDYADIHITDADTSTVGNNSGITLPSGVAGRTSTKTVFGIPVNMPAGASTALNSSPGSRGFEEKMPIEVDEMDISTGEINTVTYYLLLRRKPIN